MEKMDNLFDPLIESLKEYAKEVAFVPSHRHKEKSQTKTAKGTKKAKVHRKK